MWCGADDVAAVQSGKMVIRGGRLVPAAPAHQVARVLTEGDEVAGFTVLDTPGHSPGHVSYWRDSDRVLVCGDVMWGYNPFLLKSGVREPYPFVSPDPEQQPRLGAPAGRARARARLLRTRPAAARSRRLRGARCDQSRRGEITTSSTLGAGNEAARRTVEPRLTDWSIKLRL